MKQQVNPVVALSIAVIVLILAVIVVWRGTGTPTAPVNQNRGMPPEAAAEFQRRMSKVPNPRSAPKSQGRSGNPITPLPPPVEGGAGFSTSPTGR